MTARLALCSSRMLQRPCRLLLVARSPVFVSAPLRRFSTRSKPQDDGPDVQALAELAQIEVTDAEAKEWGPKIEEIVDWFGELQSVNTEGVEPALRAVTEEANVLRPDTVKASNDRVTLMQEAPAMEGNYVKVPKANLLQAAMAPKQTATALAAHSDEAAAEAAFIAALQRVEEYIGLQDAAAAHLKQGWLNIARARQAMGVHRVSSALYQSQMSAQAWLHSSVASNEDTAPATSSASQQVPSSSAGSDESAATTVRKAEDFTDEVMSAPAAGGTWGTTKGTSTADEASSPAVEKLAAQIAKLPAVSQEASSLRLEVGDTTESLHMFGAAPSPYVRTAQQDFTAALQQLVQLANKQREVQVAMCDFQTVTA